LITTTQTALACRVHQAAAMTNTDTHIRWEIWIGETGHDPEFPELRWRFNVCFDERSKAEAEGAWYREHGYSNVDIRCRTTRYQARRHVTTG
jgi:hypothetical protein